MTIEEAFCSIQYISNLLFLRTHRTCYSLCPVLVNDDEAMLVEGDLAHGTVPHTRKFEWEQRSLVGAHGAGGLALRSTVLHAVDRRKKYVNTNGG